MGSTTSIGELVVSLRADSADYNAKMDEAANKAKTTGDKIESSTSKAGKAFNGLVSPIGNALGGIGSFVSGAIDLGAKIGYSIIGLQQLGNTALGLAKSLLSPAASMEQNQIAFTNMLGSAQKSQAFLSQLQSFAASTPFEFPELVTDAKQMMAFGFTAQQVIPLLRSVGDATSALGTGQAGIQSIVTALGQMRQESHVNAQDLMQLTNAGIPAWQMLADAMHKPISTIQDMVSKGQLLGSQVIPILQAGMEKTFGGQMQAESHSLLGVISNLQDTFTQFLIKVGTPIIKNLEVDFQHLSDTLSSPQFNDFANLVANDILKSLADIGTLVSSVVNPTFQQFAGNLGSANGIMAAAQSALADVDAKIKMLTQTAQQMQLGEKLAQLAKIADTVRQAISNFITNATPAFKNLASAISGVLPVAQTVAGWLLNFSKNGTVVQGLVYGIVGAFIAWKAIQMGQWIAGVVGNVGTFITNAKNMASTIGNAASATINFVAKLPELIAGLAEMIPVLASNVAGWIADTAASIGAAIAENIALWPITLIVLAIAALIAIIILLVTHWSQVVAFLQSTWQRFSSWFGQQMSNLGSFVHGIWQNVSNAVGGFFSGLGTKAHDALVFVGQKILDFVAGVQNFFAPLTNFLSTIFGPWISFFQNLFSVIGQIIVAAVTKFAMLEYQGWLIVWSKIVEIWNLIISGISSALSFIGGLLQKGWQIFYNYTIAPLLLIWQAVVSKFNDLKQFIANVLSIVGGIISQAWASITSTVENAASLIWSKVTSKFDEIKNTLANAMSFIWSIVTSTWNRVTSAISSKLNDLKNALLSPFEWARDKIAGIIRGLIDNMINMLNNGIRGAANFVNSFADAINWIASKLGVSARVAHIQPALIPTYARGTSYHPGGPAIVGENGPELVYLSQGATVIPNKETMQLLANRGIPGYAQGTGIDIGSIFSLITGGVEALIKKAMDTLGVHIQLPGFLSNFGNSVVSTVIGYAKNFVQGMINKVMSLFGGSGSSGTPGIFPGSLASWITAAIATTGVPSSWLVPLETIAMHESGGNPNAVNNWDINAKEGHPSEGLMQTIMPTFLAHALPGHTNIFNPVDNAIAAIGYIVGRYGSVFDVPGIVSMANGGPYVGYANGGIINEAILGVGLSTGQKYAFGEKGPEAIVPATNGRGLSGSQTVIVELDSHQIMKQVLPEMMDYVRLKSGK